MTSASYAARPAPPRLSAPWSLRTASPEGPELDTVREWMRRPHVEEFWHQAWDRQRWQDEWRDQLAGDHVTPCVASYEDELLAYVEIYRVSRDVLAGHYSVEPHDVGVHLAVGDVARTGRGLGRRLLRELSTSLLEADPRCVRVVAEPDVRNAPSVKAFTAAGFRTCGTIELPDKTAVLCVYPRAEKDLP
ncbi:MAG: GNAT family N-acetyltransferase [Stackebrandtia sp.]